VKTKDLMFLLLAAVILLVAGYIGYTQLMPQKAVSKTVEVEVVGSIPDQLDAEGISWLNDQTKVKDYNAPVDLSGLNNTSPFGP
jgi:hypothetical protein